MEHRCFFHLSILIVLTLSVLSSGCAGKKSVGFGALSEDSSEIIARTVDETYRIVATTQIELTSAQGYYPIRAALILQRPSWLRLEMLPLIGTPDFFLTATPDEMRIFIPSRGEFYSGKPSAENLARFLPWAINIEDLVMILSGAFPRLSGKNVSYDRYTEDGLMRVEMNAPASGSQTVWVEKNGRVAKLVRKGADGEEIYQVHYEGNTPEIPVARRIIIKMADPATSVSVTYKDIHIEKATDMSIFELVVSSGSKTIQMD